MFWHAVSMWTAVFHSNERREGLRPNPGNPVDPPLAQIEASLYIRIARHLSVLALSCFSFRMHGRKFGFGIQLRNGTCTL